MISFWPTPDGLSNYMRIVGLVALLSVALLPPAFADTAWFKPFCDRVVSEGKAGTLPPHLSLVLGLGDGVQPVPVKQAAKQDGHEIRTFNVVQIEGKRSVVLMDYDEQKQRTVAGIPHRGAELKQRTGALLLRANGRLERAVTYKSGEQPEVVGAAQAQADLHQQLSYWAKEASSIAPRVEPSH